MSEVSRHLEHLRSQAERCLSRLARHLQAQFSLTRPVSIMRDTPLVVCLVWPPRLEELARTGDMMGCEYEMTETYTGEDRQMHVRTVCAGNLQGCLVDTPLGFTQCTRRTWLLQQGAPVGVSEGPKRKRAKVSQLQEKLI